MAGLATILLLSCVNVDIPLSFRLEFLSVNSELIDNRHKRD